MAARKEIIEPEYVPVPEEPVPGPEDYVDYIVPRAFGEKERDLVVAVNGEGIRIKKGVPVRIKRKFVEAIENSIVQRIAAEDAMDRAQRASENAVAAL